MKKNVRQGMSRNVRPSMKLSMRPSMSNSANRFQSSSALPPMRAFVRPSMRQNMKLFVMSHPRMNMVLPLHQSLLPTVNMELRLPLLMEHLNYQAMVPQLLRVMVPLLHLLLTVMVLPRPLFVARFLSK